MGWTLDSLPPPPTTLCLSIPTISYFHSSHSLFSFCISKVLGIGSWFGWLLVSWPIVVLEGLVQGSTRGQWNSSILTLCIPSPLPICTFSLLTLYVLISDPVGFVLQILVFGLCFCIRLLILLFGNFSCFFLFNLFLFSFILFLLFFTEIINIFLLFFLILFSFFPLVRVLGVYFERPSIYLNKLFLFTALNFSYLFVTSCAFCLSLYFCIRSWISTNPNF